MEVKMKKETTKALGEGKRKTTTHKLNVEGRNETRKRTKGKREKH